MMTRMNLIASLLFTYLVIAIIVVSFAAADDTSSNNNDNNGDGDDNGNGNNREEEEEVRVPVIDLGPWLLEKTKTKTNNDKTLLTEEQRNIVQLIRKACKEVGFFQITGVIDSDDDQDLFQRTWDASREFFDLSTNEKLLHQTADSSKYPYGYERTETLTKGKMIDNEDDNNDDETSSSRQQLADLKETFAVGPPDENGSGMPSRQWIDSSSNISITDFRNSLEAYYQRMEDLALIVLEIFAWALDESPSFFENKMDHHMSALRLVHYYPLLEQQQQQQQQQQQHSLTTTRTQNNESSIRLIRAGAHTDYGALTILATQKNGLEVLLRDNTNTNTNSDDKNESDNSEVKQRWFPVPLVPGSLIVNLGDLMQRWTNDEWVSTMHRVVMPSTEAHERRYSMAYFVNINGDTPIEPLKCCRGGGGGGDDDSTKYKVITAGEHLMAKHLASMGISADEIEDDIESTINSEL